MSSDEHNLENPLSNVVVSHIVPPNLDLATHPYAKYLNFGEPIECILSILDNEEQEFWKNMELTND